MKTSKAKFILLFLLFGFSFQFISNSLLGPEVGLFPNDGNWYPGTESSIAWKSTTAAILYPFQTVLIGPLSPLFNEPDPPPPLLLFAFATYWSSLALILHYVLGKTFNRKKSKSQAV